MQPSKQLVDETYPTSDTSYLVIVVTISGIWIDDQIYSTLRYSELLHFTVHCYTDTSVHSHILTPVAW
jgi:hypothetical protein